MPALLFRAAAAAGPRRNLAKTALQIAVLWPLALGLLPALIVGFEGRLDRPRFTPRPALGFALLTLCSAAGLATAWVLVRRGEGTPLPLDGPRRLVTQGPYAYIRNPMALLGVGQMLSVALALGSPGVLLYALGGALLWNYVLRPAEERDMARHFGASFDAYRRAVPCWIPRRRPYREADGEKPCARTVETRSGAS